MLFKPQTRENFRLRTFSGEALMTAYAGVVTAVPTPDTSPKEFAPTTQGGLQWSRWGMYVESPRASRARSATWKLPASSSTTSGNGRARPTRPTRRKAWEKILQTNADEVFSIGTVNGIRQPVVVGPKVRNVPKEGYYAWDPGGYIGLYQPDTFWCRRSLRAGARHSISGVMIMIAPRSGAPPAKTAGRRSRLAQRQHQPVRPVEERGGVDHVDDRGLVEPDLAQPRQCAAARS